MLILSTYLLFHTLWIRIKLIKCICNQQHQSTKCEIIKQSKRIFAFKHWIAFVCLFIFYYLKCGSINITFTTVAATHNIHILRYICSSNVDNNLQICISALILYLSLVKNRFSGHIAIAIPILLLKINFSLHEDRMHEIYIDASCSTTVINA